MQNDFYRLIISYLTMYNAYIKIFFSCEIKKNKIGNYIFMEVVFFKYVLFT